MKLQQEKTASDSTSAKHSSTAEAVSWGSKQVHSTSRPKNSAEQENRKGISKDRCVRRNFTSSSSSLFFRSCSRNFSRSTSSSSFRKKSATSTPKHPKLSDARSVEPPSTRRVPKMLGSSLQQTFISLSDARVTSKLQLFRGKITFTSWSNVTSMAAIRSFSSTTMPSPSTFTSMAPRLFSSPTISSWGPSSSLASGITATSMASVEGTDAVLPSGNVVYWKMS